MGIMAKFKFISYIYSAFHKECLSESFQTGIMMTINLYLIKSEMEKLIYFT